MAVSIGSQVATEVEDAFARTVRSGPCGFAYDVALWFAVNWWRLRWEPEAKSIDWRLSHAMAAIGNGIAWPNILFTSDGRHILIESRTTRVNRSATIRSIHTLDVQIHDQHYEGGQER